MRLSQRAAEGQFVVRWEDLGADVIAASLKGGIAIVRAGSARAGRQPDVLGALEVSSFAFMHSNKQRCERS